MVLNNYYANQTAWVHGLILAILVRICKKQILFSLDKVTRTSKKKCLDEVKN